MAKKMNPKSLKNLKNCGFTSSERGRELQKKSVQKRNKNKAFADLFRTALLIKEKSENGKKLTQQELIVLEMIEQAKKGNVKAFEAIRDTIGEKPKDKQDINLTGEIQKVYVTAEEEAEVQKHIDDFING